MHAQGTKMTTLYVHFYSVLPTPLFTNLWSCIGTTSSVTFVMQIIVGTTVFPLAILAPPKVLHNGYSIGTYWVGDEKHPLYPCCKHSMKLSHCYFHEIYQFYLYTSSDKSFYVAQMHFCNAEPLVMLPVIVQASIPFWATCVRKAIKNSSQKLRKLIE